MRRTNLVLALALAALAGCGRTALPSGTPSPTAPSPADTATSGPPSSPASPTSANSVTATTGAPSTRSSASPSGTPLVVADGPGWTPGGLEGPVPGPGSCRYRTASDGYLLPDPSCTPGAVDPSVTQADIGSTICRSGGYTSSVRPPESMTEEFKYRSEAAYQDPAPTSSTELDHLVPLELGGASDTRNLWAEPDQGSPAQFDPQDPYGYNAKDGVEDRLHDAVCGGEVQLVAAQQAIATNWTTALETLHVSP